MGKTNPDTIRERGASPGAYLTGAGNVNSGMIIQVQEQQKSGHGGQVKGKFKIVASGGSYRDDLNQYLDQTVTAKEVIDKIARKHRKQTLCIFNCDLLSLYEPRNSDALIDLQEHAHELSNLNPTEREAVRKSRIGQGIYRDKLVNLWGRCAVTGFTNEAVLRASHAKPWRDCSNGERLDRFNGLLLIPNLDVLFDKHLITFEKDGSIRISHHLSEEDQKLLGIGPQLRLRKLFPESEKYLSSHREKFYLKEKEKLCS